MELNANHTLTYFLSCRADEKPDETAVVFLHDDGREQIITIGEFRDHISCYSRALEAIGIRQDDLVILVLRHSQDLLHAFWGAIALGAISSIFPFLTEKLDPQIYKSQVKELVNHSGAKAVITYPEFKDELTILLQDANCVVLSTSDIPSCSSEVIADSHWPQFSPDKIAFLQHSSGTTGLQKGVALSHRSVLNQVVAYSTALDLSTEDVVVSWLPLYHDMGLIAGFVMPLVAGIPLVLMSPFKWVRDPKILFHAIHKYKGTLCWLPNFAYNHLARVVRHDSVAGVKLSSMRAFINCSEPVYAHSHQAFYEKFSRYGVKPELLSTCYAMAENTFAVTQYPPGKDARIDWVDVHSLRNDKMAAPRDPGVAGTISMVSCGFPIDGTEVRINDEDGNILPERRVGEIALKSNCMLTGYYRRHDLTHKAIKDGWYSTGDMGYLADGHLYVSGRKKDLIIVGGKNIYPQDLEAVANELPALIPGRNVAFGLLDEKVGSEVVVMVLEIEGDHFSTEDLKQLETELRRRVVQQSEVALHDVRFVEKRWLIKTSSGKISRPSNREKYIREFLQEEK